MKLPPPINQLHFASLDGITAMVVATREVGGHALCDIPNELLQSEKTIHVFAYEGGRTVGAAALPVADRAKPDDYVYTPTDIISFENLRKELIELLDGKIAALDIPQAATIDEVNQAIDDAKE